AAGIAAEHSGLKHHFIDRLDPYANAWIRKRVRRPSRRKIGGKEHRPADAVVYEIRRGLALEKLAIRRHETGADGQAVIEGILFVPKRVEPRHRSSFKVRYSHNIAEVRRTKSRPMGDEAV